MKQSSSTRQWYPRICTLFMLIGMLAIHPPLSSATEPTITNDLGMTFIRVQAGNFLMGSPPDEAFRGENEALHNVEIDHAFYLLETEVTLKQWWAVMGKKWLNRRKGPGDLPVNRVSYYDCLKFIHKLNEQKMGVYRLPTEAEWEYACRAGTQSAFSWGDTIDCSLAMYGNNRIKETTCTQYYKSRNLPVDGPAPVKSFAPNSWGFYDMHGNVWEWCEDKYISNLANGDRGTQELKLSEYRVKRGGSWFKHSHYLRSANRAYAHPAAKFKTLGFRIVLEAD